MTSPTPPLLVRGATRDPATDGAALREEGLALVERWSGAVWTDRGEHDPGVTLLELLCHGLSDVGYRLGFPIEDLLASGSAEAAARLLPAPARSLAGQPVTPDDFRRLMIDRILGVADAWLEPIAAGLYALKLYCPPILPGVPPAGRDADDAETIERARRVFARHRPLGEDLASVTVLSPTRIGVAGDIHVEPGADLERLAADIVFRLGELVGPEPRRRPLADLPDQTLADLLDGPRMARGLIAQYDLRPRLRSLDAASVERHLSAAPGVIAIEHLAIDGPAQPIGPDACFALDAGLDAMTWPLRFLVHGAPVNIDRHEVRRHLARLWNRHRQSYRICAELAARFPLPRGRRRALGPQPPLAHALPALYGVGPKGLPRDATALRRTQAAQLSGYLALFDKLLADPASRLSNLAWLLAGAPDDIDADPPITVAPDQRERLLGFVLALQGETSEGRVPHDPSPTGTAHRRRVLSTLPEGLLATGGGRGLGADYTHPGGRRPRSGLERRARLLLGRDEPGTSTKHTKIAVVEHVMLRPRASGVDAPDTRRPMAIGVVVHRVDAVMDAGWRHQVAAMLRAEAPAHLALSVRFVDHREWDRFKRLHRLWAGSLREGYDEATDIFSRRLSEYLARPTGTDTA